MAASAVVALLLSSVCAATASSVYTSIKSLPCQIGPSYWCQTDADHIKECGLDKVTNIPVMGYSTKAASYIAPDMKTFCTNVSTSCAFNGGIENIPPGYTAYYAYAMFWAPTSCTENVANGGFCSSLTTKRKYQNSQLLQMHGLWPDFGNVYGAGCTPPQPPANYAGSYQGWSQWCSADPKDPNSQDYSQCSINGNLCPASYTPRPVTQTDYELCMRKAKISKCLVGDDTFQALKDQFKKYAGAHYGPDLSFMDHEYFKHGSCVGGALGNNKTLYFSVALSVAKTLLGGGIDGAAAALVHNSRGRKIPTGSLTYLLRRRGVPRCNAACQLSEIWWCYARDVAGYPTAQIVCPPGSQISDNCTPGIAGSRNCTKIEIPTYDSKAAQANKGL